MHPVWSLENLPTLTAVAAQLRQIAEGLDQSDESKKTLHFYEGANYPGQLWNAYRSHALKETEESKNLTDRFTELLTPYTPQAQLDELE